MDHYSTVWISTSPVWNNAINNRQSEIGESTGDSWSYKYLSNIDYERPKFRLGQVSLLVLDKFIERLFDTRKLSLSLSPHNKWFHTPRKYMMYRARRAVLRPPSSGLLRRNADTDTRTDTARSQVHVLDNAVPTRDWLSIAKEQTEYLDQPRGAINNTLIRVIHGTCVARGLEM